MPHQINLCPESFKPKRQVFGARAMLQTLLVLLVVGAGSSGWWVWSLEQSRALQRQVSVAADAEIANLKVAIQKSRLNAAPVDPALLAQLQERRTAVTQREILLDAVHQGMFKPGEGHSDRLRMLAQSIPEAIWITGAKADQGRFEVTGFTLESAALNEWVGRLSTHALMRGLKLSMVDVENKTETIAKSADLATPGVTARSGVPRWSFVLVNQEPPPVTHSANASAPGAKP